MSTKFCGHKTGFNPTGKNDINPNPMGPPKTKFTGRGAVPEGQLKRFPGGATAIDSGNRRLAKSNMGDGGGSGTRFSSTGGNAFKGGKRK